ARNLPMTTGTLVTTTARPGVAPIDGIGNNRRRLCGGGLMETVHLVSDSREYDGALVSLSDAALVCAKLRKWFVAGGHMVNLHILRAGLDLPLRLTRDADIAVELRMIRRGTI